MNPIDLAVKTLILSLLGLVAVAAMKRNSAATRHRFLVITLAGICLLPLAASLVPAWQVPFIHVHKVVTQSALTSAELPNGVEVWDRIPAAATITPQPTAPKPFDWQLALSALWAVGAALAFTRIATRLLRLRRMENHLEMSANSDLQRYVTAICRQASRRVLLLEGAPNEPPMTWGFSRPVLLLPEDSANWPPERLQSVVLHELAHIERNDWLTSMFGQAMCAIFWFNPFAWFLARKLQWESEAAADDQVLSLGVSGPEYASHLLELLREMSGSPKAANMALAMARPGSIDSRLRAILEVRSRNSARGSITFALAASVLAIVTVVGSAGPTIVKTIRTLPQLGPEVNTTVQSTALPTAPLHSPAPKTQILGKPREESTGSKQTARHLKPGPVNKTAEVNKTPQPAVSP